MAIITIFFLKESQYNKIVIYIQVVRKIIDFSPLWETMQRKKITQYQLIKGGIDNKTLDKLKKNGNITLLTLEKLCNLLDCAPNDIVKFHVKKD